jgi:uncharacterized protein (TIGR02594 family)
MDTVILDVVIGLLLTYLVLALLVTKLQETVMGQLFTSRQFTMHDMLDQALQGDGALKERLLTNPIIFSLFKGEDVERGIARASGPSAIPSDLFARALLIEVFDNGRKEGKHPKEKHGSPQLFIDNLPAGGTGVPGVLRALLPGNETNWTAYEAAIARWFDQVGQRADGWFQRKAMRWGLIFSLGAAAALNVNTFLLAERLSGDPDLRRSFAALAERALNQGGAQGEPTTTPPVAAIEHPIDRAVKAIAEVNTRISTLVSSNRSFANYDANQQQLATGTAGEELTTVQGCARVKAKLDTADFDKFPISNPMTWAQLLPQLQTEIGALRDTTISGDRAQLASGKPAEVKTVQSAHPPGRQQRLAEVRQCMNALKSWFAHIKGPMNRIRTELEAAEVSLLVAENALKDLSFDSAGGPILLAGPLFLRDPEAFVGCAKLPAVDVERLKSCVESAGSGRLSLPVGWTARNAREALCRVKEGEIGDKRAPPVDTECPLQAKHHAFAGDERLGIPPMALEGSAFWSWHTWLFLFGFVVTAFFVALGAPFWFDLLGRVVKMRAAGEKPSTEAEKGAQAALPAGSGGDVPQGPAPDSLDGMGPFSDAKNFIERMLAVADKVALQTSLGVTATGVLDEATRRALVARAKTLDVELHGTDEVSLQAYLAIVGRLPNALSDLATASKARTAEASDTGKSIGSSGSTSAPAAATTSPSDFPAKVAGLAAPLTRLLHFNESLAASKSSQRAMAALFLFKQALVGRDGVPSLRELDQLARSRRLNQLADWDPAARHPFEALDGAQLDALKSAAASEFERSRATWLDWAFGELGQTEENQEDIGASNPRIVDYLRAGNGGSPLGDKTPWCGGFMAWVIQQHNGEFPPQALPVPPAGALTAENWKTWGVEVSQAEARPGDIAIFHQQPQTRSGFHVTWVFRKESDGRLYVIGGNQGDGCVSLAIRGGNDDPVVAVRRGA